MNDAPRVDAALGAAKEAGRFRRTLSCLLAAHGLAAFACVLMPALKLT
jgi:hypothetical protein